MSKYRIDDTQTIPDGKRVFMVQYAAGGNVPPQYEFDSLEGANIRLEALEKEDRALADKDLDVINRAFEARAKWLASSDDKDQPAIIIPAFDFVDQALEPGTQVIQRTSNVGRCIVADKADSVDNLDRLGGLFLRQFHWGSVLYGHVMSPC